MVRVMIIALALMILSSSTGLRVLKGHFGQTPEEEEITYRCTFILMDVVYSMLKKCWNTCPYIRRKSNVDKCMNKCVLRNIGSSGRRFASEEDIRSYIKQCPSTTLMARNIMMEVKDFFTIGGSRPNLDYWMKKDIYYVQLTKWLVLNMGMTCL